MMALLLLNLVYVSPPEEHKLPNRLKDYLHVYKAHPFSLCWESASISRVLDIDILTSSNSITVVDGTDLQCLGRDLASSCATLQVTLQFLMSLMQMTSMTMDRHAK